ncbi:MAG: DUF3450 domain-containing protein [Kiritimatiellae bacterium]|nr:DUF3450 domain-containing protein [Kiritimatiellia bacterium]MDW8457694.1 DUF3450 family protein [Verrucomicrobiota bacterium]
MNRPICCIIALFALGLAAAPGVSRAQTGELDRAQAMERWIQTRLLLSKEREEWRVQRTILEDRIDLLEREIASIRSRTEAAEAELAKTEDQWNELNTRLEALKEATGSLAPALAGYEARVRAILPALPPPVASRIEPLSRRIPENPDQTKLGISERFQNVIGILNELNKAAREITVAGEVRELEDGARAEVTAMYLGLAQAFYSNEKGGIGGVGYPGPQGWIWQPWDDRAADFASAFAIYRNEKPAAYVPLPSRIANRMEESP